MRLQFQTVDVFTGTQFVGNPLAVVLNAEGLSTGQMQAIAAEFNLAETTFILPPRDAAHTAEVRIFTPRSEMPFAGHPNVGTAFVLARAATSYGRPISGDRVIFEEKAGLVPIEILRDGATAVGANSLHQRRFRSAPRSRANSWHRLAEFRPPTSRTPIIVRASRLAVPRSFWPN
jgi:trans-2,3-dihydro-3-hydroxyanthranilate isomerase